MGFIETTYWFPESEVTTSTSLEQKLQTKIHKGDPFLDESLWFYALKTPLWFEFPIPSNKHNYQINSNMKKPYYNTTKSSFLMLSNPMKLTTKAKQEKKKEQKKMVIVYIYIQREKGGEIS